MALLDTLKKIGLSEKEAKVYLSMLELGEASVQQIARKAGVSRPSTYIQIEALMKRGLISSGVKGKKRTFSSETPEELEELLKTTAQSIKEQEFELKHILPELKEIYALAKNERPKVRFYEGVEGNKAKLNEIFRSKEKLIRNIVSLDALFQVSPHHTTEISPQRVRKGIRSKVIYSYSPGAFPHAKKQQMLREMRFIPKDKFPFSGDITVTDDLIALSAFKEKYFGVLIKNRGIADTLKALFDLAWETAEKYDSIAEKK